MTVFNDNAIGALEFTVTWERDGRSHEEWFLGRKVNPANDIFPRGMREALEDKRAGESVAFTFEPRLCIPRRKESLVLTLGRDRLRRKTVSGVPIIFRQGRFYPQGHIDGLLDVYPDTLTPFRLTDLDDETFTADRNHPLADVPVTIEARIQYLEERDTGTYGSLTHWRETACDWGPGMQTLLDGEPPDFFHPAFFDRAADLGEDFRPPEPDAAALRNYQRVLARFAKPGMRVLDLSPDSERPSGKYDAAACLCTLEYMDRPVDILRYIDHFLTPGAPVVLAFTDRFDPDRAIRGWGELHPFERMGVALEYQRMAGFTEGLGTVSMRNDWRDRDDPAFLETRGVSDPVFVAYGRKPE
jgi:FKBP-type peptidyl-prolyl cis-trans isomerase 2